MALPRRAVLAESLPGAWPRDAALRSGAAFMTPMTQIAIPVKAGVAAAVPPGAWTPPPEAEGAERGDA
jgi:hypothetical protein